jgi:hypothetical protein
MARPNEVRRGSRPWDRVDVRLSDRTRDYGSLLQYARAIAQGGEEKRAIALFDIVSRRFAHGKSRETLLSSYPAYLAGFIHPAFRVTFAPDRILHTGNTGLCSQQTYLLVQLANDLGIRARQVSLNGHVVAELWYGDDWHMFDPDYELFVRDARGQIASVMGLSQDPPLLSSAYGRRNRAIPAMYESRQDNTFTTYPAGAYFEWKSNVLLYVTIALDFAKWLIPSVLLAIGLLLARLSPGENEAPQSVSGVAAA